MISIIEANINLTNTMNILDTRLISVKGKSLLTTGGIKVTDKHHRNILNDTILLNGVPLIEMHHQRWDACQRLLATGYGIENVNSQELVDI